MANIGNLVIRLMGDNSQLTDTLHKSAKEIEKYKKAISGREKDVNTIFDYHTEGARGALSAVTGTFSAIGSVAGGLKDIFQTLNPLEMFTPSLDQLKAISITALGIVGSYAIKTAVEFEQTRISFEVLTGSVEKGMGLLNTIQNFAMQTPYQMGELQQVGKQLLAFGIDVNQIVPTLSMLGDIAKPLQQDLAGIAHIYGQIREQGQLSGHTLRELTMRAVPISTSLSAVTGIDKQDIKNA